MKGKDLYSQNENARRTQKMASIIDFSTIAAIPSDVLEICTRIDDLCIQGGYKHPKYSDTATSNAAALFIWLGTALMNKDDFSEVFMQTEAIRSACRRAGYQGDPIKALFDTLSRSLGHEMSLAEKLIAARGSTDRETVCNAVGISLAALDQYESGKRIPRDEIKIRLAEYYKDPDLFR